MADTVRLVGPTQRAHACKLVMEAPLGHVVKIAPETRRDAQNRLLWGKIKDIRDQVPEMAAFSPDDVKNRFLHALGAEMRFLPELEGNGLFPIGLRSSTLSVAQFSGLVELIDAWAANNGVVFTEKENACT